MDNRTPSNPPSIPPTPPDDYESRRHGRYRRDGASPLFPGLILIMLGVLFFLANQGYVGWNDWWKYFLIGLGGVFLVDAAVRSGRSEAAGFVIGRIVSGFALIAVGVLFLFGFSEWWPLILIVAGIAIIATGLLRRRG